MIFCHKCGTQQTEDSAFCRKCGAKLIIDNKPQEVADVPDKPQKAADVADKPQENKKLISAKMHS